MNILFVTNMYPFKDGNHYGIFVKEQIDHLARQFGVQPTVCFINARSYGKGEYLKSIGRIRQMINQRTFDAIHIHYGISGFFLFFLRPKAQVFLTLHGGDILKKQGFYLQNLLTKWVCRLVDKVFILNKEMEEAITSLDVPYEMLPCGVDTTFFRPHPTDITNQPKKVIVFPGDPKLGVKNFPLFQKVMELLRRSAKDQIEFRCIVGLKREQVRHTLSSSDCLLMTSISEGSPQIVKEALSCNLPVVSVDVGDVQEVLRDIPSCHVASERNPEILAGLVAKSMAERSPIIRESFIAKRKYDNHSVCNRLMSNYQLRRSSRLCVES